MTASVLELYAPFREHATHVGDSVRPSAIIQLKVTTIATSSSLIMLNVSTSMHAKAR
jgi:hypothetical protein